MSPGTKLCVCALATAVALALPSAAAIAAPSAERPTAQAAAKTRKAAKRKRRRRVLTVCKHGCRFRSLQAAVNRSRRRWTIRVRPGRYHQGAIVRGHRHDGLRIVGTGRGPRAVVFNGKNARTRHGLAQNAIEGENVNHLTIANMMAKNFVANGFFIHGCRGYQMRRLIAAYNRSYGLFARDCIGGRMTRSVGYGHGDSAFYVGETPFQRKGRRRWTQLDHLNGHANVLGYSGTNSKYVNIRDSAFYNNGIGIVPNTLASEKFQPTSTGIIQRNRIFWNNFNFYLPNSPVEPVSGGLGEILGETIRYPTGVGVALYGAVGWIIRNNDIFGNFKWGSAVASDPDNAKATSKFNKFLNNRNGRGGTDTNGADFFTDGSGSANCFSGNSSSTLDNSSSAPVLTDAMLFPPCPGTGTGTGSNIGNVGAQLGALADYVTIDPPELQQCEWAEHAHPAFRRFKPLSISPAPICP